MFNSIAANSSIPNYGRIKKNYKLCVILLFFTIVFGCKEQEKNVQEIPVESSTYFHNSEDFFGNPKVTANQIYLRGKLIDTINWKQIPPFDSLIVKKGENIYSRAFFQNDSVIVKYREEDKIFYKSKLDSLGIQDGLVAFYEDNKIYAFKLFKNNREITSISINTNIVRGIYTAKTCCYSFYNSNYENGVVKVNKIYLDDSMELNISFYDNSTLKSVTYGKPFETKGISFHYDKEGNMTTRDGPHK